MRPNWQNWERRRKSESKSKTQTSFLAPKFKKTAENVLQLFLGTVKELKPKKDVWLGAMTFSIMAIIIMALRIMTFSITNEKN